MAQVGVGTAAYLVSLRAKIGFSGTDGRIFHTKSFRRFSHARHAFARRKCRSCHGSWLRWQRGTNHRHHTFWIGCCGFLCGHCATRFCAVGIAHIVAAVCSSGVGCGGACGRIGGALRALGRKVTTLSASLAAPARRWFSAPFTARCLASFCTIGSAFCGLLNTTLRHAPIHGRDAHTTRSIGGHSDHLPIGYLHALFCL